MAEWIGKKYTEAFKIYVLSVVHPVTGLPIEKMNMELLSLGAPPGPGLPGEDDP